MVDNIVNFIHFELNIIVQFIYDKSFEIANLFRTFLFSFHRFERQSTQNYVQGGVYVYLHALCQPRMLTNWVTANALWDEKSAEYSDSS